MSILRHVVGIASELLTLKDPYDRPVKPAILQMERDECDRPVYLIQGNSRDVSRIMEGRTYPGAVTEVHTHVGEYRWIVHYEEWGDW